MTMIETKPCVVQKYGGTSVGKFLDVLTCKIIPEYLTRNNIVVICSARSGTTKSLGSTNLLLKALHIVLDPEFSFEDVQSILLSLKTSHLEAAKEVLCNDKDEVNAIEHDIVNICESLEKLLLAAKVTGELSLRVKDRVLAKGELLACRLTVHSLRAKNISSEVVNLDTVVEAAFPGSQSTRQNDLDTLGIHFYEKLAAEIANRVKECNAVVPVVTGFFGPMPYSLLKTIGRGYSDVCASLCGIGLGATEVQIWKEVDGIFTADPNRVPSARLIPEVTPEEAAELTFYGSEVIHPLAIDRLNSAKISLRIKNVVNPSSSGTLISPSNNSSPPSEDESDQVDRSLSLEAREGPEEVRRNRGPVAVTVKEPIVVGNIVSNQKKKGHTFLAKLFDRLDHHRVNVDLITTSVQSISLAVSAETDERALHLALTDLEKFGTVSMTKDMAIISVIGHRMRNKIGVAGEIFGALSKRRINIYLIGQGASEINISFVVRSRDSLEALKIIHTEILGMPGALKTVVLGPWLY